MCMHSITLDLSKNNYFLFDSHSRDGNGCFVAEGNSVLLMFSSLSDIECYIKREYAKNLANFDTTQFECQNVKVTCVGAATILSLFSTRRKVRAKRIFFAATFARRIFFYIFHTKSVRAKMISENK